MWIDWEIDTHTFPIIWVLFPIRFPSYGILHYMKNAGVSQSISLLGAFFPLDSHPMVCFIIWKMHGFPHQFLIVRENATKPIVWGEPGKLVLILVLSHSMGDFSPYDSHPLVYFIKWEMGFPINFPYYREM